MNDFNKKTAYKYFLGSLAESERESLEERLFTDEDFTLFLDEAEDDLIDEYLRDELSAEEKNLFNKNYLISENRREKVLAAKILQDKLFENKLPQNLAEIKQEKSSFWSNISSFFSLPQLAAASLAVLLLAFGVWFLTKNDNTTEVAGISNQNTKTSNEKIIVNSPVNIEADNSNKSLSNEISDNNSANKINNRSQNANVNSNVKPQPKENPTNANTAIKEKIEERKVSNQPAFLALSLFPATRGSASKSLTLNPNVKTINLQLNNDRVEDVDNFRAEVINSEGETVTVQNFKNTNYKRKTFNVQIPTAKLGTGDYQILLSGADAGENFQPLNYFYFSIEKEIREEK